MSGGSSSTHSNLLKWLKKLSSFDNYSASTSSKTPAIFGSYPLESTMFTAPTQSHLNKNYKEASVSAIKLSSNDSHSGSWGSPPTKKFKVDRAPAMLQYSV